MISAPGGWGTNKSMGPGARVALEEWVVGGWVFGVVGGRWVAGG